MLLPFPPILYGKARFENAGPLKFLKKFSYTPYQKASSAV